MKQQERTQTSTEKRLIPAINFHVIKSCNMKCKYCFAQFNDCNANMINKADAKSIIASIKEKGFEKITFSGGEPLLLPYLPELIKYSKDIGLTTMLVTNGSLLSEEILHSLKGKLDWIGLSIDSLDNNTNHKLGVCYSNKTINYRELIKSIQKYSYRLKINTVVSRYNYNSSELGRFIEEVKPERWKVMQALEIEGENDKYSKDYLITEEEFSLFKKENMVNEDLMIPENNQDMKGTYVMISPNGRFFTNRNGDIRYSKPITEVGLEKAYDSMNYSYTGFENRKGIYNWK